MEGKLMFNENGWQVCTGGEKGMLVPLHPLQTNVLESNVQYSLSYNNKMFDCNLVKYDNCIYAAIESNSFTPKIN